MPLAKAKNVAEVNGKRVTFLASFKMKQTRGLTEAMSKSGADDVDDANKIEVLRLTIDSWEFEGDPHLAASYDDLERFNEFYPLIKAAGEYITERMGVLATNSKN
jgi:hypothetical protein